MPLFSEALQPISRADITVVDSMLWFSYSMLLLLPLLFVFNGLIPYVVLFEAVYLKKISIRLQRFKYILSSRKFETDPILEDLLSLS